MNRDTHIDIRSVLLLANPIAGRGRGGKLTKLLCQEIEKQGMRCRTITDAASLTSELLAEIDAVVVLGGDGTLRSAVQRCVALHADSGSPAKIPAFLPLPLGTANLMCQHLGIGEMTPDIPQRAAQWLRRGGIRWLDAATANGHLFLLMVGVGLDAMIVHQLARSRHGPIDKTHYIPAAVQALAACQFDSLSVAVDGKTVFSAGPAAAFVANVPEYGLGFGMTPDARSDDGMLDVCVLPVSSHVEAAWQIALAAIGEHLSAPGVVFARGKRIEIESSVPVAVQADGDPAGFTPMRIELLAEPVAFVVPAM